ncbi:MAG: extracellular solute-binding protein [Ruoffia tabacinasalis]|uniref:Maltodextrin-binding protein n=1 Tax=Ruoffia tabacinasalis TaxID=87458 RepID=A0A5R9DT75_9LACT|nr:extracellular solute-binding protein [Ruoffia tabacinasalis]TLQ40138.1 extracellular solute-binding protein [Ruoffia tabacinasalis]HBY90825.1 sugar ABC transporter substrate-binding protein [Aerococcaceae bacterium]
MKFDWKKIVTGATTAILGASVAASVLLPAQEVLAQEETLIISAAGHYDYVIENIEAFEEEHGVSVEVWDTDMFEVLDGLALDGPAGTGADVVIAPYDRIGSLGMQGLIQPVTLNEDAGYNETDQQQVTMDGQIYGAPTVIETLVMFYNTELLDAAPETFEELEAISQDERFAFEDEEGRNVGFLTNWVDFYMTYGLLAGYGGYVFGEDGTNTEDIGLNNEGAIEAIEYATNWYQNTWPQGMLDVTSATDFINQSFMEGNTAAVITGPWMANDFNNSGIPYATTTIPTLPNGEEYKPFGGGKAWAVSAFTEKTELAQEFLNWVTSEEQQTIMYERLGEIPANQVAREQAAQSDSELTAAVIEVYENAVPMPNIPQMAEVWVGAESLMFDAASGTKTAEESANDAVELITQTIQQNY